MLGRQASDDEHAALLSDPTAKGGGESSSSSGRRPLMQQLQPSQPASDTGKDSEGEQDPRPPLRAPPPGGCSKSAVVSILLITVILAGMLVFLLLTPPRDRTSRGAARVANHTRDADPAASAQSQSKTAKAEEEDEEEEPRSRKKAIGRLDGHEVAQAEEQPMSRSEQVQRWFMKKPKRNPSDYRLSGNEPLDYNVMLRAYIRGWNDADETLLKGEVNITFRHTGGDPRRIELNSLHNEIHEIYVFPNIPSLPKPESAYRANVIHDKRRERISIELEQEMEMERGGVYVMLIFYSSKPDLRMRGAYESWLWDEREQRKVYSVHVHNEPMDARRWLPCFDEPRYKAPLTLSVSHPSDMQVIANSGVEDRSSPQPGRNVTVFLPTPPLPTYLYAFSICNYKHYSAVKDSVKYSTYLGRYGEKFGQKTLQILMDAAGNISSLYPGRLLFSPANGEGYTSKIDMIFTPDQTGAMENHGIILTDDARLWAGGGMRAMALHEVAHHIFGNRITLDWWSDTWMNEGLASKVELEVLALDYLVNLRGEERRIGEDQFYMGYSQGAMKTDVYESSAPLSKPSTFSREEAKHMFGNAYVKGSIVLRMFSKWDAVAYKKTIDYLLANLSLGSLNQRLFCDLFGRFSTSNYSTAICEDFSLNNNFPILVVSKATGGYKVTQKKFHRGYIDPVFRDQTTRWTIPLSIRWKIPHSDVWGPEEKRVMGREDDVIFIEADAPIVINGDGQYYYRVIYDDYTPFHTTLEGLANNSAWRLIQNKLLDDAMAAVLTGYLPAEMGFRFAVHSGLDMPSQFFSEEFEILLSEEMHKQRMDEFPVTEVVEQLFERTLSFSTSWTQPPFNATSCGTDGVNTMEKALDAYTKGKLFYARGRPSTEENYLFMCNKYITVTPRKAIDLIWSALSGKDDRIRSRDLTAVLIMGQATFGNRSRLMRAISQKTHDINLREDDVAFVIARLFTSSMFTIPPDLATISHFVKLRPEEVGAQWNLVAKLIEEIRMNDLEQLKLGNSVFNALITVLKDEKDVDVRQFMRITDPEEKARASGLRSKPPADGYPVLDPHADYPESDLSGRKRRELGMINREPLNEVAA